MVSVKPAGPWVSWRFRRQALSWRKENAPAMARPRKYAEDLRERAVRFYFESDRPIAHVARDLGIHKEALRQGVRQAEADQGRRLAEDEEHEAAEAAAERGR